jgi:excisionase family DNA binding protein
MQDPNQTNPQFERGLPLTEAAEILNCHPRTVRRQIQAGKLEGYRVGRHYRTTPSAIKKFRGGGAG